MLEGALALADRDGLGALTIRALATHLGVRPMAIYHHVAGKDAILDALIDGIFGEISVPDAAGEWRVELASRARSMRDVLRRHPWATAIMETRTSPGPANLGAHEAVLELLARAGFSLAARAHAYAVIDAFVYGFALQEVMLSGVGLDDAPDELAAGMALGAFPRIAELAAVYIEQPDHEFGDSFEVGLEIVLDGIARLRETGA